MGFLAAVAAVGTVFNIAGQLQGNSAQASQERQNAEFYRKQAEYAKFAAEREEKLARFGYAVKIGTQASKAVQGNVDVSSQSLQEITSGTYSQMVDELFAIKKKGELETSLASMRGMASMSRADALTSSSTSLLTVGAGLAQGYMGYVAASR